MRAIGDAFYSDYIYIYYRNLHTVNTVNTAVNKDNKQ